MKITSDVFEAYLKCPTKCWLMYAGEDATGNAYAAWVQAKREEYRVVGIKRMVAQVPADELVEESPTPNLKTATWPMAAKFPAQSRNLKTEIPVVERIRSARRGRAAQFIPIRFVWTNKVSRDDKLLAVFDAIALSQLLGRDIPTGKIMRGEGYAALKLKTARLASDVQKLIEKASALTIQAFPPGSHFAPLDRLPHLDVASPALSRAWCS
ncbi:MAG: hypothetical protein ABIH03_07465 [Pseudomonadota bacterium]